MKVKKIADEILATRTLPHLTLIKSDFIEIKKKTKELEDSITSFSGDDTTWEVIEHWKPLAEEIIQTLEGVMEKF